MGHTVWVIIIFAIICLAAVAGYFAWQKKLEDEAKKAEAEAEKIAAAIVVEAKKAKIKAESLLHAVKKKVKSKK
jgi:predicted negative regulator of RcsB-dependent stress response